MPIIHTPPPAYAPRPWQQTATPVDQYGQADYAAPTDIIWHGDQTSAVQYFKEVNPDPLRKEPTLASSFSPLFGFFGRVACTLLISSFLALSGCDYIDRALEPKRKIEMPELDLDEPTKKPSPRFLVGRGRTKWHAEKAIHAHGVSIIGGKDPFSKCYKKKIRIRYVGKPTCRRIKRRLYECEQL